MKGFIISTTNSIEGRPVKRYIDAICVNVVVGTNIFSDFAASFTDFFGGRSSSYKRKLELIYNEASKELKDKALGLGANAIVGFRVDFDEISGKDKSMFMVSASGTACVIEKNADHQSSEIIRTQMPFFELEKEEKRRQIISGLKASSPLLQDWAEFLIEFPQEDIIEDLVKRYIELNESLRETEFSNIERVISATPTDLVVPIVYKYHKQTKVRHLIEKLQLFDPKSVYEILMEDLKDGLRLISSKKVSYDSTDLLWMKKISDHLANLPDTGKIEVVKGGLFSKEGSEKFICQNGHKNDIDFTYCEKCNVNIRGLSEEEDYHIRLIKQRCEIIESYLSNVN